MSTNPINTFRSSKWKLLLSNIPSVTDYHDVKLYEQYVKGVSFPSYNLDEFYSEFKGSRIRSPITKINENLQPINISFKASENLENYYNLFTFIQYIKYGQNLTDDIIRKNVINNINIIILDNEKREQSKFILTNAFLSSLSSLDLTQGTDSEITFSCNFSYEEIKQELIS